jgi:hypothetical protein
VCSEVACAQEPQEEGSKEVRGMGRQPGQQEKEGGGWGWQHRKQPESKQVHGKPRDVPQKGLQQDSHEPPIIVAHTRGCMAKVAARQRPDHRGLSTLVPQGRLWSEEAPFMPC